MEFLRSKNFTVWQKTLPRQS